ncbi:MAG: ABC transporter substrate-binding protein [Bacteroidaceae bacterium]|nr:ABC transporter substrate-binding protein [Bacteroidaceae bacterium]
MNYKRITATVCIIIAMIFGIAACGGSISNEVIDSEESAEDDGLTVVGFSQPGAESDWRVAHTESVKNAFTEENGYKLIYKDAQSKLENQIKDVRAFIQQGVDIIILSPLVETGWDSVLEEARQAKIPVLITDRLVDVDEDSLYLAYIGSDFLAEGQKATSLVENYLSSEEYQSRLTTIEVMADEENEDEYATSLKTIPYVTGDTFDIVHIRGTEGSSAEMGRTQALMDAIDAHEDWNLLAQANGDFNKAKAYEAMKGILRSGEIDNSTIDMVYCDNDNEAYGVIDALKEAGLSYGVGGQIIIVSFDGCRTALEMCKAGEINYIIECNPLQGQELLAICNAQKTGGYFEKLTYIRENYFHKDKLTDDFIAAREY